MVVMQLMNYFYWDDIHKEYLVSEQNHSENIIRTYALSYMGYSSNSGLVICWLL